MKLFFLLSIMSVKNLLRDWKKSLIFFIVPIVVFIGFFSYYHINNVELNYVKPINVGVIVEEEMIYGQMLVDDFRSKKDLSKFFVIIQEEPSILEERFKNHDIDALVTIPQGFVDALMTFQYRPIRVQMHTDDPVKSLILYQGFRGYEKYIQSVEKSITAFYDSFSNKADTETYWKYNDALSIELIMTVLERSDLFSVEKIIDLPSVYSMDYYFIALTVLFAFYFSLINGITLITEIKQNVFHRLMTTKVGLINYLATKLSINTIATISFVGAWSALYLLLTQRYSILNARFYAVIILVIVMTTELSMLLTLIIRNENDFFMVSTILVFFMAILGGSIIPIHFMPNNIRMIAAFTPNYQIIKWLLFIVTNTTVEREGLILSLCTLMIVVLFLVLHSGYKRKIGGGI